MRLDDEIRSNYWLSRTAFLRGDIELAERYYTMNRKEHAIDLYYEVVLPPHMMFVHPLGTVLGRATYGDYLCVYQNVGVGSDIEHNRPVIGEGVVLFPGCKVLGKTTIGDNCLITANTVVHQVDVPPNSIVFGYGSRCMWEPTKRNVIRDIFKVQHAQTYQQGSH